MADYKERFEAMKAAENAMKTTPKTREVRDTKSASTKTERTMPSPQALQEAADAAMRVKEDMAPTTRTTMGQLMKKGGKVKKMADGGTTGPMSVEDWAALDVVPKKESLSDRVQSKNMNQGDRQKLVRQTGKDWYDMAISGGKSALPSEQKGMGMKNGGKTKCMAGGGKVSSASKRADGCAIRGKTRGKMV